jgi:hypothetical protein
MSWVIAGCAMMVPTSRHGPPPRRRKQTARDRFDRREVLRAKRVACGRHEPRKILRAEHEHDPNRGIEILEIDLDYETRDRGTHEQAHE